MTRSASPARKVSGKRLRLSSPNRRKISSIQPQPQLGNFSKLFAILSLPDSYAPVDVVTASAANSTAKSPVYGGVGSGHLDDDVPTSNHYQLPSSSTTNIDTNTLTDFDNMGVLNHKGLKSSWVDARRLDWSRRPSAEGPSSGSSSSSLSSSPPCNSETTPRLARRRGRSSFATSTNWRTPSPPSSESSSAALSGDDDDSPFSEGDEDDVPTSSTSPPSSSDNQLLSKAPKLGSEITKRAMLSTSFNASHMSHRGFPPSSTYTTYTQRELLEAGSRDCSAFLSAEQHARILAFKLEMARDQEKASHTPDAHSPFPGALPCSDDFAQRVLRDFHQHDTQLRKRFADGLPDVHVFIDWSNISISLWDTLKRRRHMAPHGHFSAPISFDRLIHILERRRSAAVRELAGSRKPDGYVGQYFDDMRTRGYNTSILSRVQRTADASPTTLLEYSSSSSSDSSRRSCRSKMAEQCVDEILQLKMSDSLIQGMKKSSRGIMVLATGDANEAEFSKGFLSKVQDALELGWIVELYSFRDHTSAAWNNKDFLTTWDGKFSVHYLDEYADRLIDKA